MVKIWIRLKVMASDISLVPVQGWPNQEKIIDSTVH